MKVPFNYLPFEFHNPNRIIKDWKKNLYLGDERNLISEKKPKRKTNERIIQKKV